MSAPACVCRDDYCVGVPGDHDLTTPGVCDACLALDAEAPCLAETP